VGVATAQRGSWIGSYDVLSVNPPPNLDSYSFPSVPQTTLPIGGTVPLISRVLCFLLVFVQTCEHTAEIAQVSITLDGTWYEAKKHEVATRAIIASPLVCLTHFQRCSHDLKRQRPGCSECRGHNPFCAMRSRTPPQKMVTRIMSPEQTVL
jgi:hypothetical protein